MVYSTDRSKAVIPVLALLFVTLRVYSTGRFVLCLTLCYFGLVLFLFCFCFFFSVLFALRIPRLEKRELILGFFRTFVRFALVWFCLFPLPIGVWIGVAVCDCGTPWTFLLPLFLFVDNMH